MAKNYTPPSQKKNKHLLNEQIRFDQVRLVGDTITPGIYDIQEALKTAKDIDCDLVLLSDKSYPPICKVIDYKKFIYDESKKKKSQKSAPLKEIKLSPNIGEHDMDFKSKNAFKFLEDGSKVKLTMEFHGRSIMFKDQGEITLLKFIDSLSEVGLAESLPKLEGKKMIVFVKPK